MRRKFLFTVPQISLIVLVTTLVSAVTVLAATGATDSPAAPTDAGSQMYTLDQIYNLLETGSTTDKMTSFSEPSDAPGIGTMHTLNDILSIAPAPDNTDGATAADVFNGKTFWGLTDGEWGSQTGTYTAPERFTDNGDGTVTDNQTGLMWTKSANHGKKSYHDAWNYCDDFNFANHSDWRLPQIWEIYSLLDQREYNPALPNDHPFTYVVSSIYWTYGNKWVLNLYFGYIYTSSDNPLYDRDCDPIMGCTKAFRGYVWPVRGGQ